MCHTRSDMWSREGGGVLLKRPPRIDSRLKYHKQVVLKTCSNLDPHMNPGPLCFEHYCIGGRNMAGLKQINRCFTEV